MNVSETQPARGGFEDRLEAELVKVVAARPAGARRRGVRSAVRRPAVKAGVLAVAIGVAAAFAGLALSHRGVSPVHIKTAAFSVDTYQDGTVHVTWDKSRYIQDSQDTAALQRALRQAGLPVLIKTGVFCQGPGDNGDLGPGGVGPGVGRVMTGENEPGGGVVFVFTPAAVPAGKELFIGYLTPAQLAITQGRPGSVERLVPAGVALTCTTQVPR